jgi:hypothetical protein
MMAGAWRVTRPKGSERLDGAEGNRNHCSAFRGAPHEEEAEDAVSMRSSVIAR